MGRHVAVGRRRGIAGWPLVAAGVVVLLAAVTVLYTVVLRKDDTDADSCTGSATLPIMASAGAAPAARALSDAWNASRPAARGTCVTSTVTSVASDTAASLLTSGWAGRTDAAPGVWMTDDAGQLAAVDATRPELTAGHDTEPVATSPVVLAATTSAAAALGPSLQWGRLPGQLGSAGSVTVGGRAVSLLVPDPRSARASGYALSSVFAEGTRAPSVSRVDAVRGQLSRFVDPASSQLSTTGDALDKLADDARGTGTVSLVPTTEAELAAWDESAGTPLTALYPSGPAAGDEFYVVPLSADWTDATVRDAATRFHAFVRDTAGQQVLAAAHLRVPGLTAAAATGIDPAATVQTLAVTTAGLDTAWAAALGLAAEPGGTAAPSSSATPSSGPTGTAPSSTGPTSTAPTTRVPPASPTSPPSSAPSGTRPSTGSSRPSSPGSSPPATSRPTALPTSTSPSSTPSARPGPAVTFLVDTSQTWSTDVEGTTRTGWLQQALTGALGTAASGSPALGVGLWSTSSPDGSNGYVQLVATGPVIGSAAATARSEALRTAIGGLDADGTRRYYAAAPAVLQAVAAAASPTTPQHVVLITDGPDQTPGTPRAGVVAAIADIVARNPDVHLDVLGVGEAAPDDALRSLAQAGNGTYYDVRTTPSLPQTVEQVLTAVR